MLRFSSRTWPWVVLVSLVVLPVAGHFFAVRGSPAPEEGRAGELSPAGETSAGPDVAAAPRTPAAPGAAAAPGQEAVAEAEDHDGTRSEEHGAIRRYKELTRYPASSRRLTAASVDLLQPNKRYERRQPLSDPEEGEALWEVLFTADRYFVRGREPISISLSLWRDGEPVRPRSLVLTAAPGRSFDLGRAASLSVEEVGDSLVARFVPEEHWSSYLGQFRVRADFSAEGLGRRQGSLAFYLTPEERIPGRFTGDFEDRLSEEGDLVIDVGLDVDVAGRYRVEGNLFDHDDEPVAWARFEGHFDPGRQSAPLRYYGLILRDAEARPPFALRDVRGHRVRAGDVPDREDLPTLADEYRTRGDYALSRFRSDEYDSPRKQQMLDRYRDALARGVRLTDPDLSGLER